MENLFHRISIRKYLNKPVEKEKILEILRAAMAAPSACNQRPWRFTVVTAREKIRELAAVSQYSVFCCSGSGGHQCGLGKSLDRNRCPGTGRRLDGGLSPA